MFLSQNVLPTSQKSEFKILLFATMYLLEHHYSVGASIQLYLITSDICSAWSRFVFCINLMHLLPALLYDPLSMHIFPLRKIHTPCVQTPVDKRAKKTFLTQLPHLQVYVFPLITFQAESCLYSISILVRSERHRQVIEFTRMSVLSLSTTQ